ncbi:MAG: lytic transglycosylase domain-containing protein [Acidobacteriia bacterium]|nr:lytic transglycosylase domain-containing protein [Terriglobia bacterium]
MKIHLFRNLACASVMLIGIQGRAQNIVAVHDENGHVVWVNNEEPPKPQSSSTESKPKAGTLVYWSRTEKRWKPVPPPSPSMMKQARKAAQEVSAYVSTSPVRSRVTVDPEPVSPDTAALTQGRQISAEAVDDAVESAARRHGVDPNLVRALIKVESNFNPHAVSRKGAVGLMQLMPHTARSLNVTNAFDPNQNVDAGVRHLKSLLENYNGNLELSLAAYNAGSGAVNRSGGVPPYRETRDYVKKITGLYTGRSPFTPLSQIHESRDSEGHRVYTTE